MLLELLGSSAFGVLSGMVGNIVNTVASYKLQKLKNDFEIQKAEMDIKIIQAQSDAAIKIEQVKTEGQIEVSELAALTESYKDVNKTLFDREYMDKLSNTKYFGPIAIFLISLFFAIIDLIKSSVRPILTYYAITAATVATWMCWESLKEVGSASMELAQAANLFQLSIMFVFYMTSTIVGWWFADRRLTKSMNKIADTTFPQKPPFVLASKK